MNIHTTLSGYGSYEFTEKKSVFIGYANTVVTEEEALSFIAKIKKKHADATHNVYAYSVRENNTVRFSDDGEPHGTAGIPVLEILKKEEITDAVVVVTRYFGGKLLGTGGLVRAYSASARGAVEAAGIVRIAEYIELSITLDYSDYGKINTAIEDMSGIIRDGTVYGENVILKLAVLPNIIDSLFTEIRDLTGGRAKSEQVGKRLAPLKDA